MAQIIPLFPLDLVLFPGATLPLHIFEPRYKEMIGLCLRDKLSFGVVRVKEGEEEQEQPGESRIAGFGCTADVLRVLKPYPDGRMDILAEGRKRFEVMGLNDEKSYLQAEVEYFEDDEADPAEAATLKDLRNSALDLHAELVLVSNAESPKIDVTSAALSFQLAQALPVDLDFKQSLLEMHSELRRLRVLLEYYTKIIPRMKLLAFGKKKAGGNGWVH